MWSSQRECVGLHVKRRLHAPFTEEPLSSMRRPIAKRLSEAKVCACLCCNCIVCFVLRVFVRVCACVCCVCAVWVLLCAL